MDITYHGIKQLVLTVEVFKLFNYLATLTLLHFLLLLSKSIKKKMSAFTVTGAVGHGQRGSGFSNFPLDDARGKRDIIG